MTPSKVHIVRNRQPHKPQRRSLVPKGEDLNSPVKMKGESNVVEEITSGAGSDLSEYDVEALTFE